MWRKSSLPAVNLTTYSHTPRALYAQFGSRKPGHSVPVRILNPQRASRSHALMLTVALSIPVLRVELVWAELWCVKLVWVERRRARVGKLCGVLRGRLHS